MNQIATKYNYSIRKKTIILLLTTAPMMSHAVDLGPITITGFIKAEAGRTSNVCVDCQAESGEDRHRPWADDIAPGKKYGTKDGNVTLFQPYIGTKDFDLGKGFKIKGLYSQRWRDGKVDLDGVEFEKNLTLSHEDYGRLQVGDYPSRGWSVADYPYGTQIGVADAWASSGSGYGLLTQAVRYSLPLRDVANGDLHFELTTSRGDSNSTRFKPLFVELYAQYVKGPWVFDFVTQDAENGRPDAWSKGYFRGITNNDADDLILDTIQGANGNRQRIAMLMARYQYNAKTVLFGGIKQNYWKGARAIKIGENSLGKDLWAPFLNVNKDDINKAYSASSTDISLGATYRIDTKWSTSAGLVHLGKASTRNPTDRGQHNSMTLATVGVGYDVMPGLNVYAFTGMVQYKQKGLAPLSMPGHSSFSGIDSRVSKSGNWAGLGVVYTW